MNGFRLPQTKSLVKFTGHIYALLLSDSDIQFLGTTGPEPEPDSKKTAGYPAIRIWISSTSLDCEQCSCWIKSCLTVTFYQPLEAALYTTRHLCH